MRRIGTILAHAVDGIMARLWPLDATTRAYVVPQHDDDPAHWLTEAEANTEAWEAPPWMQSDYADLEPWERDLIDCAADPDDLWAAQHRRLINLPTDQTVDEFVAANRQNLWPVTDTPAGAANPLAQPAGGAGRDITNHVANVIAVILRGQGIASAPIYADLAARELLHHFQISRK